MRTVSIRLCDMEKTSIPIGFVGENLYTQVRIDSKKVFDDYPDAIASLTVHSPHGEMYPGFVTREGDVIIWEVTNSDLVYGGNGEIQLAFLVDDVVAKSYICRTYVSKALISPDNIPTPIASWIDAANVVLGEAEEVFEALDEMTVEAETLPEGSSATAEISDVDGHKNIAFGIPKGDKGDKGNPGSKGDPGVDGFSPTLVVSTITGGHRITITDKNGTSTVDIMDGEKGDTGNGIASVVLNQDYTLTINYTNGQSYTTTSIRGAKGETGETGATPVISIGTVTTGDPDDPASATMDTTDPAHPVLSMVIPQGQPGSVPIDDTTTASDKVWSSEKVDNEVSSVKNAITQPTFVVGNAEEVLSDRGESDEAVYLFRKTGGNAKAYNREQVKKIVGGTVAWNQIRGDTEQLTTTDGITTSYNSETNKYCIKNDSRTSNYASGSTRSSISLIKTQIGHKYAIISDKSEPGVGFVESNMQILLPLNSVFIASASNYLCLRVTFAYDFVTAHPVGNEFYFTANIIDLTQLFGSTIADYLYTLETQTAGSGVALFRSLFGKSYYQYNSGSLESVNVSEHRLTGKNLLNEYKYGSSDNVYLGQQNEYKILLKPGTYTISVTSTIAVALYMKGITTAQTKLTPGSQTNSVATFTVEQEDTLKFWAYANGLTVENIVQFQLELGSTASPYEPYQLSTYPMPNVTLRGIPKLVNGEIVFDGDELTPDGTVKRKYGIVDLGSLTWSTSSGGFVSEDSYRSTSRGAAFVCSSAKYSNSGVSSIVDMPDKTLQLFSTGNYFIWAKDSDYSDKDTFKASLSGIYLVYELQTPATESADPYQELQICNRYGTEEYVDRLATAETSPRDVAIPCGHDTFYPVNVFDYIDELTKPDADFIADANIPSGKYFSVGNGLYLSTSAIAQGETITPGTNCTAVSLADALNAINQ